MARSKSYEAAAAAHRPRPALHPARGGSPREADLDHQAFDATVEVAMVLGVDPRKADQMVRGTVRCRTAPARPPASRCSRPARRPKRPAPRAPTSSAATS